VRAIETHGADPAGAALGTIQNPGVVETVAVARQAARDGHAARQMAAETLDQRCAVDPRAVRQQEHSAQVRAIELRRKPDACCERVVRALQGGQGAGYPGALEVRHRHAQGVVADRTLEDLAGRRTACDNRVGKSRQQFPEGRIVVQIARRAKGQHERSGCIHVRGQRAAPPVAAGVHKCLNMQVYCLPGGLPRESKRRQGHRFMNHGLFYLKHTVCRRESGHTQGKDRGGQRCLFLTWVLLGLHQRVGGIGAGLPEGAVARPPSRTYAAGSNIGPDAACVGALLRRSRRRLQ
jgi:hypothetical protein